MRTTNEIPTKSGFFVFEIFRSAGFDPSSDSYRSDSYRSDSYRTSSGQVASISFTQPARMFSFSIGTLYPIAIGLALVDAGTAPCHPPPPIDSATDIVPRASAQLFGLYLASVGD